MAVNDLIRRRISSSAGAGAELEGLPADFVCQASDRLGILALVYAGAYSISVYVIPLPGEVLALGLRPIIYVNSAVFIALAVGLFLAVRTRRIRGRYLRLLGFGFEVYGAIGIEWGLLYWNGDADFIELGLSWTAVWIVVFPLFVPAAPWKTLLAATAAASVRPVFLLLLVSRGVPMPSWDILVSFVAPTYICVGIAVIVGAVVFGLGRDVSHARRMGSYRLIEKLGEGGMGEVWRAGHRLLARPAAIKLIRGGGGGGGGGSGGRPGDPTASAPVRRFEREVQAAARLRSPHTIEVYDYGITSEGTFYYVMELLDGVDLDKLVTQYGPLPPARVIHIMSQACHSLAEAHELEMVHRDIKPANLFLCRQGRDFDVVKVLDFGLVKEAAAMTADSEQLLTQAGAFYGTPAYASPEMARGDADRVDHRTDLYSLGCVGYWLLTGRPVFEAPTPMGVLVKHNTDVPEPPSRHAPGTLPPGLDALVLDCLAKQPEARVPSADVLRARLAELSDAHPWPMERAQAWWERNRPPLGRAPSVGASGAPAASTEEVEPAYVQPARAVNGG